MKEPTRRETIIVLLIAAALFILCMCVVWSSLTQGHSMLRQAQGSEAKAPSLLVEIPERFGIRFRKT
jgi:hypothetical protein